MGMTRIDLDLSSRCLALMLQHLDRRWHQDLPHNGPTWSIEEHLDLGPWDKIFACDANKTYDVWAEDQLIETDAIVAVRVTIRENYPDPGSYSYISAPFNMA